MPGYWYAGIRVVHILCAVLWVGTAVFLTAYLAPAIRSLGPRGAPVMAELLRRRMGAYLGAAGVFTVVSGLWLYWVFSRGLEADVIDHGAGLLLGVGGLCGVVAVLLGGLVIERSAERAGRLSQMAASLPDGSERAATLQTVAGLQRRVTLFSRIDVVLLLAALLAMCLAHAL